MHKMNRRRDRKLRQKHRIVALERHLSLYIDCCLMWQKYETSPYADPDGMSAQSHKQGIIAHYEQIQSLAFKLYGCTTKQQLHDKFAIAPPESYLEI